jgi:TnpA family transposase
LHFRVEWADTYNCPLEILNYITKKTKSGPLTEDDMYAYSMSRQSRRHHQLILEYLKIKPHDKGNIFSLAKEIAKVKTTQLDIINCITEELLRNEYELPLFPELELISQNAMVKANSHYFCSIYKELTREQIKMIENKILIRSTDGKSLWNKLKDEPEKPTLKNLKIFIQHYLWLKSIDFNPKIFKGIPVVKLDKFYQEATMLDLYRIKRMKKIKRLALVSITVRKVVARGLDDLGDIIIKIMNETEALAKHKLRLYKMGQLDCTDEIVEAFKGILNIYKTENSSENKLNAIDGLIIDNMDYFLEKCDEYDAYSKKDHLIFMQQRYNRLRKELLLCLSNINLRSSSKDKKIEKITKLILRHAEDNSEFISLEEFSEQNLLSWIPVKWRKFIIYDKGELVKKRLELFLFVRISLHLKTRDLFIRRSGKFINYAENLIGWKKFNEEIKEYGKIINKSTHTETFVKNLKFELGKACEEADLAFDGKINAKIKKGKVFLEKIVKEPLPQDFKVVDAKLNKEMAPVILLDIIAHVARSLHFEEIIRPVSGYDSKLPDTLEHIIAALFCYGCNIGASETVKSISNISRKQIGWINSHYISEEVLDKCIFRVINCYNKFRLPKFWGTGEHVSVDGSKWEMYRKNLMAQYSVRHGGYGGMGYYHVSDTYIALFSNLISCGVYEALHIIDGVLKNESDIKPKYVHGDTHSQSLPIFGLMYLLGIKLMPRIKGIKKLILYKVDKKQTYIHLNELLREAINWQLIETHAKDMYRIALSIKSGTINYSVILEKICSKEPKNKIYYAFRELGRVVRTCYLLGYICDFDLRKVVHASTCKSEEFNEYRDWIAFVSDTIKHNDRMEQRKFIKYNHLVTNMVSLYNVQVMSVGVKKLEQKGFIVPHEVLRKFSPYRKTHIIRLGSYELNLERIREILCPIDWDIEIT